MNRIESRYDTAGPRCVVHQHVGVHPELLSRHDELIDPARSDADDFTPENPKLPAYFCGFFQEILLEDDLDC